VYPPAIIQRKHVPRCGLMMLPKTGHTINREEPAAFNHAREDFIHSVEHGRWRERNTSTGAGYTLVPRRNAGSEQ
jgi:hypothetical protein